ncbi:hypothetical protein [Acinetobacter ihumii]|uniref:hypothetical protein n=1 Tax=Acinetobacter ihumii TaxID=2483802 RepID=UPI0010307BF7|nr:hypothetical protein [Acinetobacter ihumii]
MSHYDKTAKGHHALNHRHPMLNVRQRRLLLLIGTDDFHRLSDELKHKIAPPDLVLQLEEMELIHCSIKHQSQTIPLDSELSHHQGNKFTPDDTQKIPLKISNKRMSHSVQRPSTSQTHFISFEQSANGENIANFNLLTIEEIKLLMTNTLSQYCGLLAQQLVEQIKAANHFKQLKVCQMQWITHLQESRIPPQQLNHTLQQINYALHDLQNN